MICSLDKEELLEYVVKQLNNFFPDNNVVCKDEIRKSYYVALERLEYCFTPIRISGYKKDNEVYFNHLHSDQYTQF